VSAEVVAVVAVFDVVVAVIVAVTVTLATGAMPVYRKSTPAAATIAMTRVAIDIIPPDAPLLLKFKSTSLAACVI